MVLAPPIECEDLPLEGNTVEYVYSLAAKCLGKGASANEILGISLMVETVSAQ
jgi:hypothetical protein